MVGEIFSSFQWKIRRVLAYSLHDVALILGQERACSDLLSVLDEYTTKDVDDVKLGVLTHLTELLSVCLFSLSKMVSFFCRLSKPDLGSTLLPLAAGDRNCTQSLQTVVGSSAAHTQMCISISIFHSFSRCNVLACISLRFFLW